jgi:nitrogen regulatory protein PII
MFNHSEENHIVLICFIVNFGLSGKLIHEAKHCGIQGDTVLLGRGTVNNRILDYIGLSDIRKEIILMVADSRTANTALERIDQNFKFEKPNHGIAFTTLIGKIAGTRNNRCDYITEERGCDNNMYHVITAIVDKGKAEDVINAAVSAGSKGGTIINARGAGIHETSKLFLMDIEPEKEVVIILSECDKTDAIVSSIRSELKIDEPGKGIVFVQDVIKTYGIYK